MGKGYALVDIHIHLPGSQPIHMHAMRDIDDFDGMLLLMSSE